jgi:hypothetical protein
MTEIATSEAHSSLAAGAVGQRIRLAATEKAHPVFRERDSASIGWPTGELALARSKRRLGYQALAAKVNARA